MSDNTKIFPCGKDDKTSKKYYAKAYILPQEYENLFSVNTAFEKGTIFKDLYDSYYKEKDKTKDKYKQ